VSGPKGRGDDWSEERGALPRAAGRGAGGAPEAGGATLTEPVLDISGFSVVYRTASGDVRAVQQVNLSLDAGEVVGLVGESW
jgi:hypothetical protein